MIIGPADKNNLLTNPALIADIKVSRDIRTKVAEMAGAVGIREPAGYEDGSFTHHYLGLTMML